MKKYEKLLLILPILSILVVIFSLFTYGIATIHSDTAVESTAINSIINNHSLFPKSWIYNNGDINFMRLQIFLFLPFLVIKNWAVSREVGALILILLSCFALYRFSKKYLNNNSWILMIPLVTVFYADRAADVVLYSTTYTSIILYACIFIVWSYNLIFNDNKGLVKTILIDVLLALVVSGGTRWLAEVTLPLLVSVAIVAYIKLTRESAADKKGIFKAGIISCSHILIPSGLGVLLYKWVGTRSMFCNASESGITLVSSIEELGKSFLATIGCFFKCFGFVGNVSATSLLGIRSIIAVVVCLAICFIVPIMQLFKYKEEDEKTKFFLVFAYSHNVILFVVSFITGKTTSVVAYRVLSIIFFATMISCRYIWKYWIDSENRDRVVWMCLFTVATLIMSVSLAKKSVGWKELYNSHTKVIASLEEHGLTKGYGGYWNAYMYEAYANGDIRFGGIDVDDEGVYAGLGLVDRKVFEADSDDSFVIFTELEKENADTFNKVFGEPIDQWKIEGVTVYYHGDSSWETTDLYVYTYDYDVASKFGNL